MYFSPSRNLVSASFGLVLALSLSQGVLGISCNLKPSYATPVTADGWQAQLVAAGFSKPRGIQFDGKGNLLVVQSGSGIVQLSFHDGGSSCLEVARKTMLINSTTLNHGIALSEDGKTLYASSSESVFSWSYDADAGTVGSTNQTLITGMTNDDHTTRTLLLSKKEPSMLLVSRGSTSNIDLEAADITSGHSQIKAFDISNLTSTSTPYEFTTSGRLLGWGLRNSVGVAEEPITGRIYSVENSADEIRRNNVDIHQNNPGEEMNYHGFLNASTTDQGGNYGYPHCFAVWNASIPDAGTLTTGDQFTLNPNSTMNDTTCSSEMVPPMLTFQAHMAPLDIKFLRNGTLAFVSFHGSWDRSEPSGYKVSAINFDPSTGLPMAASGSMTSYTDIFSNPDNSKCPDDCFRPVGLAIDGKDRVFMSSDATGELWVLVRTVANGTGTNGTETGSGGQNGGGRLGVGAWGWAIGFLGMSLLL